MGSLPGPVPSHGSRQESLVMTAAAAEITTTPPSADRLDKANVFTLHEKCLYVSFVLMSLLRCLAALCRPVD